MVVFAPRALCNIMYDLGYAMVHDDRKDIGKLGGGHTFMHHYMCGTVLMILAGLGKYVDEGKKSFFEKQWQEEQRRKKVNSLSSSNLYAEQ
jgi:hypothetical protein